MDDAQQTQPCGMKDTSELMDVARNYVEAEKKNSFWKGYFVGAVVMAFVTAVFNALTPLLGW